jgi:hypothetical protein
VRGSFDPALVLAVDLDYGAQRLSPSRMGDPPPFERAHDARRARVRPGGQRPAALHKRLAAQHALARFDGGAQIASGESAFERQDHLARQRRRRERMLRARGLV